MKIITIVGNKSVGKTSLFFKINKIFNNNFKEKKDKFFKKINNINYLEENIFIGKENFKLIDCPFFSLTSKEEINVKSKEISESFIIDSFFIFFVIDSVDEQTILLNNYLIKKNSHKSIIIFANKSDNEIIREKILDSYYVLNPEKIFFISTFDETQIKKNIQEIFNFEFLKNDNKILNLTENLTQNEYAKKKVIIFGAPNSGKSTLMNYLLKKNRSIVSEISGTTKEPVSSDWYLNEINFELVDTEGITNLKKIDFDLWKRCDISLIVIDASLPLTRQILQIVNLSEKYNKTTIIILNKCDIIQNKNEIISQIKSRLKSLKFSPLICISALKGHGINILINEFRMILKESKIVIPKKNSDYILKKLLEKNPPKFKKNGKMLKIYFFKFKIDLVCNFIFFVNNPSLAHFSYKRYISNFLRKELNINRLPIRIFFKKS